MTKEEALAFDLALEALENSVDLVREDAYNAEKLYGNYSSRQGKVAGLKVLADDHEKAITAIKQVRALDKKAENARELGLDYEPVQEPIGYVKLIDTPFGKKLKPVLTVAVPVEAKLYTTQPAAQRQWVPVTKELLSAQHPWLYESMWIAMKDGSVMTGHYAWMQGRYPDRFLVGDCASLWAFEATHVMPMNQPKHPAKLKEKNNG
jgi:hypothetical protein